MDDVKETIGRSSRTVSSLADESQRISEIVEAVVSALRKGGKLIVFGNGGSAAQAQHVVAELVVRFKTDRRPLPAVALTTDTSIITAGANDYGFSCVFARQLEALAAPDDIALALSTSGNSPNVLAAVEKAKKLGLKTLALLGKGGGKLKGETDIELIVDSQGTDRVQEAHLLILHILAETVERVFLQE
jgi:D-sedoheptulose 7-phosphate isomerase